MQIFSRWALCATFALCACNAPTPERQAAPVTPTVDRAVAMAERPPAGTPSSREPVVVAPSAGATQTATEPIVVPPGALYLCVSGAGSQLQQTPIEFAPAVGELCSRHPEMGPCRYERDACRRRGGRVFAAGGTEITKLTEAEYDKRVMRTRLRAD